MSLKQSAFLTYVACAVLATAPLSAQESATNDEAVTRPVISEDISPLVRIGPIATDGYQGEGFLRRPPGEGPFPAVVLIHGGLSRLPTEVIRQFALRPYASRFLEAGYVVAVITYRSRDRDPASQSPQAIADALAAVDYVKSLPYVDPSSVVVNGSSGGGDLTLEVAAATDVAAIAPEEPASLLMAGIFTADLAAEFAERIATILAAGGGGRGRGRGRGGAMTVDDLLGDTDLVQLYAEAGENETLTEKVARIRSPILIIQGGALSGLNRFNEEIVVPTLQKAGKSVEVRTYPGEVHGFAFNDRSERPAMVLRAFEDIDAFFRRHLQTQPSPIDPVLVEHLSLR